MGNVKTNEKLDILFLCDNSLGGVGCGEESLRIIINGIKNEYKIALIEPGRWFHQDAECQIYELLQHKNMKKLARNPISLIRYLFAVKKIVSKTNPTVIHTQSQISFFMVGLLKRLKLIHADIVLMHTDRGLYTKYNFLIRKIFLIFMKELDVLITTTLFNQTYWKQAIVHKYPRLPLRYELIENTAGELFEEFDESRLTHHADQFTIGFAGRYCAWKNWLLAEEICIRIAKKRNVRVAMAVACVDDESRRETDAMFCRLKSLLGDHFDGKINVKFKEMDQFYYNIDVFVLTSKHNTESFGRTLVEAMSRKTVVLTTDAGGAAEVVGDPANVCTLTDEFVERIIDFYDHPQLMEIEKERNFVMVKERYSLANNIAKHRRLYNCYVHERS